MSDVTDAQVRPPAPYRVNQLVGREHGNGPVEDFESLVTHHPIANARATVVDGVLRHVEDPLKRSHALIGGETQEVETRRTDGGSASVLGEHQVLLMKDFMLEDSRLRSGAAGVRDVDVSSPVAGYIGRAGGKFNTVDIYDREGGVLVARVLHLEPLLVSPGDTVEYGQALGVQSNRGLPGAGKHVHMEVDTRHYNAYENYIEDLVSGRLSIDPARRAAGMQARPVVDDGTIRVGESAEPVRDVQRLLNEQGFRDANGRPFDVDGVYRLSMQPAVIRYQQQNGLPASGDLDPATMRVLLPAMLPPEVNPQDPARPRLPFEPHQPFGSSNARPDPMLDQARTCVRRLDESMGRAFDDASERMACSVAVLARGNGLTQIDHVLLSIDGPSTRAGQNVFVVQGDPADPAKRRAHMATSEAIATPVEQSLERLQAMSETATRTAAVEEVQRQQRGPVV